MRRIIKFLKLPFNYKLKFLEAVFWLLFVRLALVVIPFRKLRELLRRLSRPAKKFEDEEIVRTIWSIETASKFLFPRKPCLTKSLVEQMMLARRGYQTQLRIGVSRGEESELKAHAWLENMEGMVIGSTEEISEYTRFPVADVGGL